MVTLTSRDGTFLVEGGKIVCSLKNLRFNVSVPEMLSNVVQIGEALRTCGEEAPVPAVVPALKVRNFNVTSVSVF